MPGEHPFQVIARHCQQAGVQPIEMLAILLEYVQSTHKMRAGITGFASGADNKASVIGEIQELMGLLQIDKQPNSLLVVLDLVMNSQYILDSTNAINENIPPEQRAALTRRAQAEATFRLILRDLINEADSEGLKFRMNLEERAKKGEIKLFDEHGRLQEPPDDR
jgi:hypothetical protein